MESEDTLASRLGDRLLARPGARATLALRRLLEWVAADEPASGPRDLDVLLAIEATGLGRSRVLHLFRDLESIGCGRLVVGRRGHRSRFRPGPHDLGRVARRALAGAPAADRGSSLITHSYRLRPDQSVELSLPRDLTAAEADRLASFVRTLPFSGAPEAPASSRPRSDLHQEDALVIGMSLLRISIPVMVAIDQGLFRREGLRVEVRSFETAQPLMDAIVAGEVSAGGFIAFPISMAAELRSGVRLRHAGVMMEDDAHPVSRFLVRADAGITGLADLVGRRVGILPTVAYRGWLDLLLRSSGVDPSTVEVVELGPQDTVAAVRARAVDAVFTNDPAATAALATGEVVPLDPEPRVGKAVVDPLPFGSFVLTDELVRRRPRAASAVVRALDAAIEAASRDAAQVRASLAAHLPRAQRRLIRLYPPASYGKAATLSASALSTLGRRYRELQILDGPVAEGDR